MNMPAFKIKIKHMVYSIWFLCCHVLNTYCLVTNYRNLFVILIFNIDSNKNKNQMNNKRLTRVFQEPESLICLIVCLSRAIILTRSSPTILTPFNSLQTFVGLIIRIISAIESFWLNLTDFGDAYNNLLSDPIVFRNSSRFLTDQKSKRSFC